MEANELTTHLSEELISRLESVGDFDTMMTSEMFQQGRLYMDIQEDDENEADDIIVLHMDIRQPLHTLKKLIEHKIGVILKGYVFWLQDAQVLEPHKNLVDQCVKGEGLVQINVQIQTINQRINIVDVLKPTDAALAAIATEEVSGKQNISKEYENFDEESSCNSTDSSIDPSNDNVKDHNKKPNAKLSWVLDNKFKREQMRLRIPEDPYKWTTPQVKHWFQWAVRQFDLTNFVMSDWAISGKELCSLSHEEFTKKLQCDPGKVFWTHLQLLKECKFVSVIQRDEDMRKHDSDDKRQDIKTGEDWPSIIPKEHRIMRKNFSQASKSHNYSSGHIGAGGSGGSNSIYTGSTYVTTGNNGQTQLWQFLLEILTNREHIDIIQWVGTDGEFKLTDPEGVARLWGDKKKKPAMNYEKLSRALRYYYDGDMISKVCGKRFAYKFDCDLKLLIGYDAAELAKLVYDCPFLSESALEDKVERSAE